MNYHIPSNERILPEIEKLKPGAVILDFALYDKIGGIETVRTINYRFEIPVWYE